MRLVTDNPNPLAITFTDMQGIAMGDFKKVVVPRTNGAKFFAKRHELRKHVPVADLVLEKYDCADRIELSQDNAGAVSYTVCLDPKITQGQKDFSLSGHELEALSGLVQEAIVHSPFTDCGGGTIHFGCLNNLFPVTDTVDRALLTDEQAEIGELYDTTISVLAPMAMRHGGSFEVVDIYDASEIPLNNAEGRYLSADKVSLGFELVVFGSCSGCTAFNLTYGQAPNKIAEVLKPNDRVNTMQVRQLTQKDDKKTGQALIFK